VLADGGGQLIPVVEDEIERGSRGRHLSWATIPLLPVSRVGDLLVSGLLKLNLRTRRGSQSGLVPYALGVLGLGSLLLTQV
jgi:hypothetical protein